MCKYFPLVGKSLGKTQLLNGKFRICEDRAENGYPPRSDDCLPAETEFAEQFELAQEKKLAHHKRTMLMWKNALTHTWNTRPIEETQKLIDRMPKIMKAIIEADGGKTKY